MSYKLLKSQKWNRETLYVLDPQCILIWFRSPNSWYYALLTKQIFSTIYLSNTFLFLLCLNCQKNTDSTFWINEQLFIFQLLRDHDDDEESLMSWNRSHFSTFWQNPWEMRQDLKMRFNLHKGNSTKPMYSISKVFYEIVEFHARVKFANVYFLTAISQRICELENMNKAQWIKIFVSTINSWVR